MPEQRRSSGLVQSLLNLIEKQNEQILELSRVVAELRKTPVVQPPVFETSPHPLKMPEDEEDIQWQLERGVIDKAQAENLLKELDFFASEIVSPTPR